MPKNNTTSTINELSIQMAKIGEKVDRVVLDVQEINRKLDGDYATKEWCESHYGEPTKQFKAIVSLILSAVIVAIVSLVIKK